MNRRFDTIREWLQYGIDWAESHLAPADLDCDRFHVAIATPDYLQGQEEPPVIEGVWKYSHWSYFTWPLVGGWLICWRKYA